jgi:hypothetical protein
MGTVVATAREEQKFFASFFKKEALPFIRRRAVDDAAYVA